PLRPYAAAHRSGQSLLLRSAVSHSRRALGGKDPWQMKEIDLELWCDLTDFEVQERAQQLGAAVAEYDQVDSDKKDSMKEYTEQLKEIAGRMRRLSRIIRNRTEVRIVKCTVSFHTPVAGTKRIVRLDTGEIVREEAMSIAESQQHLFVEGEFSSEAN